MKKSIIILACAFFALTANAQDSTKQATSKEMTRKEKKKQDKKEDKKEKKEKNKKKSDIATAPKEDNKVIPKREKRFDTDPTSSKKLKNKFN